jgi:hypothetical protein
MARVACRLLRSMGAETSAGGGVKAGGVAILERSAREELHGKGKRVAATPEGLGLDAYGGSGPLIYPAQWGMQ